MSAMQEQILDAVKILANNAVNQSNATTTIAGRVVEQVDLTEYKVDYLDNIITAYNNNPSITYNINDIIYVLVPEGGDLSGDNIIIGAAKPSASTYITSEESDIYVPISENLLDNINEIELCTYHSENGNYEVADPASFYSVLEGYLKKYRTYLFSARIRTNIPVEQQQSGNYGIILNLPILKNAETGTSPIKTRKAVAIDVNTMQGNPYRLNEYTLQNIYFELEEGDQIDRTEVPTITYFVQDFAQDESALPADIFIKDIELKAIDVLQVGDQNGYYLTVVATEGNFFLNEKYSRTKTLSPILKINSKNKKVSGYDCYWFVEDTSINTSSAEYFRLGGVGWRCLNKKTNVHYNEDGKMTWQYVTNAYTLEVPVEEVESTLKYKCVLTKDDVVVSGSIQLENLSGLDHIKKELITSTGYTNYIKDTGYINLIARLYYEGVTTDKNSKTNIKVSWQRFDKLNNFINSDNWYNIVRIETVDDWLETEIKIPCSIVEQLNTINCTFYSIFTREDEVIEHNLGSSSIIVTTSDDYLYKIAIQNGDVIYKYDSDGDSPMVANYDGPVSSKVNEIQPITFKIYKNDGSEFNEVEYLYCNTTWRIPVNSMIRPKTGTYTKDDNYYYIKGQGIIPVNYTIADTYNVKKSDNTIILEVDFRGTILNEAVNIKFLKDGESGTNGSKYTAVINYNGYAYGEKDAEGKIQKLQCVHHRGGWFILNCGTGSIDLWPSAGPPLTVSVYKDGSLMDSVTPEYTVEWGMFDPTATNPNFNINSSGYLSYKSGFIEDSSSIVQAKITVGEAGTTNSQEAIYAYYPIEITYLNLSEYSGVVPNLLNGFSEVVYAADGTNPKYDNANPFLYADNLSEVDDATDYYKTTWSVVGNLKAPRNAEGVNECKITPITKFDNGISKNYVKVIMEITADKRDKVDQKVADLYNDLNEVLDKIAYEQNKRDNIVGFSESFVYNDYINSLDFCKDIVTYRSNLITYINELKIALENLNTYCKNKGISISVFDYTAYYNNIISKLNTANTVLYELGHDVDLSGLESLSDCKIDMPDEADFKNRYGAGSYETLKSFVQTYNDILEKKYWIDYGALTKKDSDGNFINQTHYLLFAKFISDVIALGSESHLMGLQTEQEFVNVRDQIIILGKRLYTPAAAIYSYDDINNRILKNLDEYFIKYQDDYYVNNCNNIIANLELKHNKIQNQINDFEDKIIFGNIGDFITHIKPIVMMFNRYELSNLNGWDGNKLYTNDGYLLAPQIGAGLKEGDRSFSGVVMGVKRFNDSSKTPLVGLFGYSSGVQSYFMNSRDGSVIMGKSGPGQIITDPSQNQALLYSSNYFSSYKDDGKPSSYSEIGTGNRNGMLINLTAPYIHFGDVQKGKIYSGSHSELGSTNDGFYLSHNGLSIGSKTYIDSTGTLRLGSGAVVGSGNHWTISKNTSNNSYIAFGAGDDPKFVAADSDEDTTAKVYIGTDGFTLGRRFSVSNSGELIAYKGKIGGWNITKNKLEANGITISANGNISGDGKNGGEWSITRGNATFNKLIANKSGTIGGWAINEGYLKSSSGDMTINGNGSMRGPNWSISAEGKANFQDITCANTWSFGSGKNTWTNTGFAFGSGSLGGNTVNDSLAFTNGSMTMGQTGQGKVGVAISKDSVKISGDIYANNGYFKGVIEALAGGNIGGWSVGANNGGIVNGKTHLTTNELAINNVYAFQTLRIGDVSVGPQLEALSSSISSLQDDINDLKSKKLDADKFTGHTHKYTKPKEGDGTDNTSRPN